MVKIPIDVSDGDKAWEDDKSHEKLDRGTQGLEDGAEAYQTYTFVVQSFYLKCQSPLTLG